jgi:DNA-binding response OmpR family regulator
MVSAGTVPPRLLIVDSRAILHLEYAACTVAVGFDVEQADNTDQGLAKAMLLAPDIVLTDCSADTEGAGVEFCRRLKTRVATSRIPVLGLIGAGDQLNARAAVVAGCTVLAKPCSPERLLVEIVRVLGVWPPGPAAAGSTTVDQLTLMLGRVLHENAQLMERNKSLSDAAQLWANWYERTLKRANQAPVDGCHSDWSLRQTGQDTPGVHATLEPPHRGRRGRR